MSPLHTTHDEPQLTAAQRAELEALDAALRGDAITDDALAAFIRDVRATAPVMAPEARQDLNEQVAAGFPRRGLGRLAGLRMPVGGPVPVAASVLLALVVVGGGVKAISSIGQFQTQRGATPTAEPAMAPTGDGATVLTSEQAVRPGADEFDNTVAQESAGAASSATAAATAKAVPRTRDSAAPEVRALKTDQADSAYQARAVQRNTQLEVRVKSGGLPDASRQVGRIARRAAGYIVTSDVSLQTKGAATAHYLLRVDATKLDAVVEQLSDLGTVTAQNQQSLDVTNSLDSAQGRLDDANAARRALLKALARATTSAQVTDLKAQLGANRRLRARLDAQVKSIQVRVNRTEIDLTISAPTAGDASSDDGQWSLGDAAGDAGKALTAILGTMLVGAAAALPFAIVLAAAWLLLRGRRRRGRERALDR